MTNLNHVQLAPDFTLGEFLKPGWAIPEEWILDNLINLANRLQVVRDITQRPIRITSGYRTPEHNAKVGGGKNSYHLKGMAADIVTLPNPELGLPALSPKALQTLLKTWNGGLGSYDSFTHVDIGPKRRW